MKSACCFRPGIAGMRGWAALLLAGLLLPFAAATVRAADEDELVERDNNGRENTRNVTVVSDDFDVLRVASGPAQRNVSRANVVSLRFGALGDDFIAAEEDFNNGAFEDAGRQLREIEQRIDKAKNNNLLMQPLLWLRAQTYFAVAEQRAADEDPAVRAEARAFWERTVRAIDQMSQLNPNNAFVFESKILALRALGRYDANAARQRETLLTEEFKTRLTKAPWARHHYLSLQMAQWRNEMEGKLAAPGQNAEAQRFAGLLDGIEKSPDWAGATAREKNELLVLRLKIFRYLGDNARIAELLKVAIPQAQAENNEAALAEFYLARADALYAISEPKSNGRREAFMDYLRLYALYPSRLSLPEMARVALRLSTLEEEFQRTDWKERAIEFAAAAQREPTLSAEAVARSDALKAK